MIKEAKDILEMNENCKHEEMVVEKKFFTFPRETYDFKCGCCSYTQTLIGKLPFKNNEKFLWLSLGFLICIALVIFIQLIGMI